MWKKQKKTIGHRVKTAMHSCAFFFVKQPPASDITLVMPGSYLKPLRPFPCHLLPSCPLMLALSLLPPLCPASSLPHFPTPLCPTSRLFPRFSLQFSSSAPPLPHLSTFLLYTPFFHFTLAYALLPSLCPASPPLFMSNLRVYPPLYPLLSHPSISFPLPPFSAPPPIPRLCQTYPVTVLYARPLLFLPSFLSPPYAPAFFFSPSLSFYAP